MVPLSVAAAVVLNDANTVGPPLHAVEALYSLDSQLEQFPKLLGIATTGAR